MCVLPSGETERVLNGLTISSPPHSALLDNDLVKQLSFPRRSGAVPNCPGKAGISSYQHMELFRQANHILPQEPGVTKTSWYYKFHLPPALAAQYALGCNTQVALGCKCMWPMSCCRCYLPWVRCIVFDHPQTPGQETLLHQ